MYGSRLTRASNDPLTIRPLDAKQRRKVIRLRRAITPVTTLSCGAPPGRVATTTQAADDRQMLAPSPSVGIQASSPEQPYFCSRRGTTRMPQVPNQMQNHARKAGTRHLVQSPAISYPLTRNGRLSQWKFLRSYPAVFSDVVTASVVTSEKSVGARPGPVLAPSPPPSCVASLVAPPSIASP